MIHMERKKVQNLTGSSTVISSDTSMSKDSLLRASTLRLMYFY